VLRCFDNDNIVHVDGNVNPIRDKETIDIELQLKILKTLKTFGESVRLKPETKKRKLKSALDRIRETLCKLNRQE
jgi:ribosome-binding ATPase YchF (GTP1/OBG family)